MSQLLIFRNILSVVNLELELNFRLKLETKKISIALLTGSSPAAVMKSSFAAGFTLVMSLAAAAAAAAVAAACCSSCAECCLRMASCCCCRAEAYLDISVLVMWSRKRRSTSFEGFTYM